MHGLVTISPSSTAAFNTVDTLVKIVRTLGRGQLLLEASDPRLDHRRLDRAELPLAEVSRDVESQPQLCGLAGGFGERLCLEVLIEPL